SPQGQAREDDHRRRARLHRDARDPPAREPQPAPRAHAWRLLRAEPRRGGPARGDLHGGLWRLQGRLGRLPHAAEAYFPAALEDGMTVLKAMQKTTDPKNIAVFGTSAGGALTLEMVLKAKQDGVPLPAAIAPGTPMSDVTKVGDTF